MITLAFLYSAGSIVSQYLRYCLQTRLVSASEFPSFATKRLQGPRKPSIIPQGISFQSLGPPTLRIWAFFIVTIDSFIFSDSLFSHRQASDLEYSKTDYFYYIRNSVHHPSMPVQIEYLQPRYRPVVGRLVAVQNFERYQFRLVGYISCHQTLLFITIVSQSNWPK